MLFNSDEELEKKTHAHTHTHTHTHTYTHTHTHKEDKIFSEGLLSRKIKIH